MGPNEGKNGKWQTGFTKLVAREVFFASPIVFQRLKKESLICCYHHKRGMEARERDRATGQGPATTTRRPMPTWPLQALLVVCFLAATTITATNAASSLLGACSPGSGDSSAECLGGNNGGGLPDDASVHFDTTAPGATKLTGAHLGIDTNLLEMAAGNSRLRLGRAQAEVIDASGKTYSLSGGGAQGGVSLTYDQQALLQLFPPSSTNPKASQLQYKGGVQAEDFSISSPEGIAALCAVRVSVSVPVSVSVYKSL